MRPDRIQKLESHQQHGISHTNMLINKDRFTTIVLQLMTLFVTVHIPD